MYRFIILPFVGTPSLDVCLFLLLITDTILIAAGGYIINDIHDHRADMVNKPSLTFIPSLISLKAAGIYYKFILLTGLIIALYIGQRIHQMHMVLIYPVGSALLYMYSVKYKNTVIWGNVIVSVFVAFVSGIVLIAERASIVSIVDPKTMNLVIELFVVYMIFSFLVNMIREIVKDLEDAEGDTLSGGVTFGIRYGMQSAVKLSVILAILTILAIIGWLMWTNVPFELRSAVFLLLFVAAPLVSIIQILTKSNHKSDFTKISTILKWTMVAGLGSIVLISSTLTSE
ncbi:MAG: UbiA family prenyltransferase [Saprospiraceae bacterium]|nr:UbiA family prenyltransferase [Saprospiraceae bacterium]